MEIPNLTGKRILIVDDDAEVVKGLTAALAVTKATVFTASDGNAGVEACTTHQPDAVILDIMLPKRSGFLVMEKIRTMKDIKLPKVIMITANPGQRHKTYAETLGVADYINKPFTVERLMKTLSKIFAETKDPASGS